VGGSDNHSGAGKVVGFSVMTADAPNEMMLVEMVPTGRAIFSF